MRLPLCSFALSSLLILAACGGGKSARKPDWVGNSSGIYEDNGKWYYGIGKASGDNKLERRKAADEKARADVVASCKDVKAEDAEVVDHFVDGSSEQALARIDASKCPDAKEGGKAGAAPAKAEEKPAEAAKAEEKPAEKPAEEAKPAEGEAKPADGQ